MQWEYKVDKNPYQNKRGTVQPSNWWEEVGYLEDMGKEEWQLCTIYSYGSDVWYYWRREVNEDKNN